ncbi:MAG: hypothetical protein M3461_07200 [Pseudomonadota bacterium]|nr:hypothetical protein [Pseudomonadota bacterium]
MTEKPEEKFSLVIGGPFYRLQQRLGLLGPDLLPPMRTALLFAAMAWLPPALLSVAQGLAWSESLGGRAFFLDFGAYARFIIAIVLFVVMERVAEKRIGALIRQFTDAGLVPPEEGSRFITALQLADRRSSSALAEAIILGVAYVASVSGGFYSLSLLQESWLGTLVDGHARFSAAGWWILLVSLPLFWFLLLRWLWRFVVWTRLLRDLAKVKLRLVATHPDQSGGIGFLGLYPPTFSALVFALSCVTASAALQEMVFAGAPLASMRLVFGGWLVLVLIIFVGPLLVFAGPLARLKERALLEYGALAGQHNRAFEAKWVRREEVGEAALGAAEISSLADLASGFQAVKAMKPIPAGKETLIPLVVAAGLPWLAVAATQVPLAEILKKLASALL